MNIEEIIGAHQPRKLKGPDANDKKDERPTPEQIQMQTRHLCMPVIRASNDNEGEVDTRKLPLEHNVEHAKKYGRIHFTV